jgi:hypothetical protein
MDQHDEDLAAAVVGPAFGIPTTPRWKERGLISSRS